MRRPIQLALLACVACAPQSRSAVSTAVSPSSAADLVLTNGKIITVDARDRIARAVAVRAGKIVAVGSEVEVRAFIGPRTQRIDLGGRTVTPGLLDAHAHLSQHGVERLLSLDLNYPNVKSVSEIVALVAARARTIPAGQWVEGRGWDKGKLTERRFVQARDLDPVAPAHPVYLFHTTGHYGVANSAALALAGITRETPDPPGGTIDRYPDGTPTGVLKEAAQGLVRRRVPPRSAAQFEQGIREMVRSFNSEGMTGAKDPSVSDLAWGAYQRVLADNALTVRIFALRPGGQTAAAAERLIAERAASAPANPSGRNDRLISGGVKLFADGSGGARTAWLHEDWNQNVTELDRGNRGYPAFAPDTIRRLIKLYHDAGMHVSVHAVGDRAIDWVVDSYAEALRAKPTSGLRHGIIHANIPTPHALNVMADLQRRYDAAYPEPSATFTWWIGDTYAANFGVDRSRRLNPFRTYLAKGILWANGSDFSVTPFAARYGIWSAIARSTLLEAPGDPFGRAESVDVRSALRAVTIWAARQMFLEQKIGSIEIGKYADLAVWDRDFYTVATDQIKDARCLLTMLEGKIVYRAPDAPPVLGEN